MMPEFSMISTKPFFCTQLRSICTLIPILMLIAIVHVDAICAFSHQPVKNINKQAQLAVMNTKAMVSDTVGSKSPYAGQQNRSIKALSPKETEAILDGSGMVFGGMAKAAELNGYPGPKHVLELYEAGRLALQDEQLSQTRALFEEMRKEAMELGGVIVGLERALDTAFLERTVIPEFLEQKLKEIGTQKAKLRNVHLQAHLQMTEILTEEQIRTYNVERGYQADPCKQVPDGHDPVMWRMHNQCN